jgi:pullulanase-type alpha-1,6-glucosidase
MRHLAFLARAGLTHVHLLPSFDISSVDEDKSTWLSPGDLTGFPPDSDQQQAKVAAIRDRDGFNWGYDPFHFLAPEGSYSTNPDGPQRILEFREMVQGLSKAGLRVVMDSVFNHTTDSGQDPRSVLDKVVPGYYHRLNLDGDVETSSCCQNTATEHVMMEKLMIDALVLWARDYKVDGFRFDLMGHHMRSNILKAQQRLAALRLDRDGVDGRTIYLYGEGWNFGEVANNARGVNATQTNMAGTGVGTFNDRLRDGARGGGPFSGVTVQGFLTGLYTDPNATGQGSSADQLNQLLLEEDWIRVGLAGGLKDFTFTDRNGNLVKASAIDYNGQPAGYTAAPQELISYVSAHDNETLFDAVQLKAPASAGLADRVRMHDLGVSLVGLGQGIPFFHAGDEMLRSKDMDRNSYNSGDWFNTLDFTYQSNNWGTGLPLAGDNQSNWSVMKPLLADPSLKAREPEILGSVIHFAETLAIRRSSHLFHLRTAAEVQQKLRFHNTGTQQIPGLIVMSLSEGTGKDWGACTGQGGNQHGEGDGYRFVVVLFNADKKAVTFSDPAFKGAKLQLHPYQHWLHPELDTAGFQKKAGTFTVPSRTTAVFVCGGDSSDEHEGEHGTFDQGR